MKEKSVLVFATILLFAVGLVLISGCIGETKEKKSVDESGTENIREPPTWSFKGTLASSNDSDTYELDLRDKPFGCLLTFELTGPNPRFIHPMLLDSNETPIFQDLESDIYQLINGVVVDGGEIYYVVIKMRGDRHYTDKKYEYTVNIRLFPHSTGNSSDTAVPIEIPGKVESKLVSRSREKNKFTMNDVNWFKIGPVNSSGLLVIDPIDSNNPSRRFNRNIRLYLLDDKAEVIRTGVIEHGLHCPVDNGNIYYIKVEHISKSRFLYPSSYPFSINIDLVPNSVNNDPDNAIPIHLPETVEGKVVSIKDTNWFRLDLRNYSDGDIIINISLPEGAIMANVMKMELLGENKTDIIGYVYARPLWQGTFQKGMPRTLGYYPEKEIEGERVYYVKVYMEVVHEELIDPLEAYKLEIKGTMVPLSVMGEEPNIYTLTGNTADTAVTVNLPAHMKGRISSEDDIQWFKTDLSAYPNGGILIVTLTMPSETEPRCGFVCRQPVCFNVPYTPLDCSHYQFKVFERDKKTEVMEGSVAPKDKTIFRDVLERGGQYYFRISAPHGRYNKEESYTIDVRFYPDK